MCIRKNNIFVVCDDEVPQNNMPIYGAPSVERDKE